MVYILPVEVAEVLGMNTVEVDCWSGEDVLRVRLISESQCGDCIDLIGFRWRFNRELERLPEMILQVFPQLHYSSPESTFIEVDATLTLKRTERGVAIICGKGAAVFDAANLAIRRREGKEVHLCLILCLWKVDFDIDFLDHVLQLLRKA